MGALRYFGFSEYFIKWTEILYKRFYAKIQNSGIFFGIHINHSWCPPGSTPFEFVLFIMHGDTFI